MTRKLLKIYESPTNLLPLDETEVYNLFVWYLTNFFKRRNVPLSLAIQTF